MHDIDQNRFALMTVLRRVHEARPDDYADPETLLAMSDEALRSYAIGLLHFLATESAGDEVAAGLQQELGSLLDDSEKKRSPTVAVRSGLARRP
jgi:hypothetical protein